MRFQEEDGVIDSLADHVDGVSRIVLKNISFFITEKCDMLVINTRTIPVEIVPLML